MQFFLLTIGSFLLTMDVLDLQLTLLAFLLTIGAFSLDILSSFTYNWSFFCLQWESLRLIRALRACKQRSLTVSKIAPTVNALKTFSALIN